MSESLPPEQGVESADIEPEAGVEQPETPDTLSGDVETQPASDVTSEDEDEE